MLSTPTVATITTQLRAARTMAHYRAAKRNAGRLDTAGILELVDAFIDTWKRLNP